MKARMVAQSSYSLRTGGNACDGTRNVGGDDFINLSNGIVATQLTASDLRVLLGGDTKLPGTIDCIINR